MNDDKNYRGRENGFKAFENDNSLNSADGGSGGLDLNSFSTRKKKFAVKQKKTRLFGHDSGLKHKKGKFTKAVAAKLFLSIFLVFTITGCLIAGSIMVYAFGFVDDSMVENLEDLSLGFTTTIYVKDASQPTGWVENQRLHGEYNRIWVSYEKMPENLINAFISIEDRRFYDHQGIDWKRTASAFANLFFHFYSSNQGGSTITQQLVKNLTGDDSTSPMRKVREIMRARQLEKNYSKETIIECYLNTIPMAKGIYGVEVASNYYFGKSVDKLTLSECAVLAAITKAPEHYRPDTQPENNLYRRTIVLNEMLSQGHITQQEYDEAKSQNPTIVAKFTETDKDQINSYFVDALISEIIKDLAEEYNYDQTYASKNFYNGGYKIYCTMDPDIQNAVNAIYADPAYVTKSKKGQISQSAITVMDYEGHIVGIAGGLGEKTGNRVLNRATQSPNQAGSTMKPMGAYALAVENNLITYSSNVVDEKVTFGKWSPRNWYGSYWGKIKVNYALERSVNTIPIKLVNEQTPQACYDFCTKKLGLTNLTQEDINLSSLAIGGNYRGITTTESAAAYAVFGNGGKYYKPTTYYKVEDQHGKTILKGDSDPVVAIGEDTATIMNHLLQGVVYGAHGTGSGADAYTNGNRVYGKTGTSDNANDSWFVGGTPYYIASCWYGFDQDEKVTATGMAKKLWGNVMKKALAGKEARNFADSEYVTKRYYCSQTGLCATAGCPSVAVGWYKTSYMPVCTTHKGTTLGAIKDSLAQGNPATSSEPSSSTPASSAPASSAPASSASPSSSPASSAPETPGSSSSNESSTEPSSSSVTSTGE